MQLGASTRLAFRNVYNNSVDGRLNQHNRFICPVGEQTMSDKPFEFIQSMTRQHRADHGCGAYTFEDGPGLTALAATHRASRVLELGTALGYTGCCLAAAASNTHVDSIEMDTEHVRLARENIARALERGYPIAYGCIRATLWP